MLIFPKKSHKPCTSNYRQAKQNASPGRRQRADGQGLVEPPMRLETLQTSVPASPKRNERWWSRASFKTENYSKCSKTKQKNEGFTTYNCTNSTSHLLHFPGSFPVSGHTWGSLRSRKASMSWQTGHGAGEVNLCLTNAPQPCVKAHLSKETFEKVIDIPTWKATFSNKKDSRTASLRGTFYHRASSRHVVLPSVASCSTAEEVTKQWSVLTIHLPMA